MSKIHILENSGRKYKVVIHTDTPSGSNTADKTWKAIAIACGLTKSILPEGAGLGQITTVEKAELVSGDKVEFVTSLLIESGGTSQAQVSALVDKFIIEELKEIKGRYKYYGYTQ